MVGKRGKKDDWDESLMVKWKEVKDEASIKRRREGGEWKGWEDFCPKGFCPR